MSALFERWTGLALRDPWWLLLALFVGAAAWRRLRRGEPRLRFPPAALFEAGAPLDRLGASRPPRTWRVTLLPLPRTLQVAGLLLAVVALARPASRERVPHRTEGIEIVLCLDTSSSMTANDMDGRRTRLEVAREAATRFVSGRKDDRIGLVAFARYPDLLCPPTRDRAALAEILSQVGTVASDGPEDATGIGTAVARAAQVLGDKAARTRVVILLTDGEENVARAGAPGEIAPAHAAQLCERTGVRVYAVVAGAGRRNPSGAWVPLDTRAVERLAARTGGAFFAARDAGAVEAVYAKIDALEKAPFDDARSAFEDRFLPFLALGLAFLLAGRLLGATALEVLP